MKVLRVAVESRRTERVKAQLPVIMDSGERAVTKDISPSGVYIQLPKEAEAGRLVSFRVDFRDSGADMSLYCIGTIVRVEPLDGQVGVGVSIIESKLERSPYGRMA